MWIDHDDGHAGGYPHECKTSFIQQAKEHEQASLIFALECLMHESWDGLLYQCPTPTDVRIHYITTMLRHFTVTPKPTCGYRPDLEPFINYGVSR